MNLPQHNFLSDNSRYSYLLVLLLIISFAYIFGPSSPIFYSKETNEPTGFNDFLFYYGAGQITKAGNPDKIYSLELQQQTLANVVKAPVKKLIPYLYPPQSLLFFEPLAHFSVNNAFLIWQSINVISTLALVLLLYGSGVEKGKLKSLLIIALLIASSSPWLVTIMQGQVTILMTLGLLAYHLLAKYKKFSLAGILIVILAFKPPLILGPVLYLLIIYRKKLWVSTIVASLIIVVLCSLIFGFSIWQSYINIMLFASSETESGASLGTMCNIRSLGFFFFGEKYIPQINLISFILWLMSVIATIIIGLKVRNKPENIRDLAFGLIIALSCLFGPWSHLSSLLLLAITIGYMVKNSKFSFSYIHIGAAVNFGLLTMFVITIIPQLNPLIWVPAQILLIVLNSFYLSQENKKSSLLTVVS